MTDRKHTEQLLTRLRNASVGEEAADTIEQLLQRGDT
jgi:hypothetical protein